MNEIMWEQGRLWQNIIGDQNDADFNTIRRVLSQLIDALVEPEPPARPDEWREGDYALWDGTYTAADGYKPPCLVCLVKQYGDAWETTNGGYLYKSSLTVPTARQLAKKIGEDEDGNDILVWAMEHDRDDVCKEGKYVIASYSDEKHDDGVPVLHVIRKEHAITEGIPVVTKSQVNRPPEDGGFGGTYPPKEE